MTNFTNPNEMLEEQFCFTYEEFKQFLSVEKTLDRDILLKYYIIVD